MRLTEQIQEAGIVGCGGAGFPTHAKYETDRIETIIINGAECEPLLQNDCYLMRHMAAELVRGAGLLLEGTSAKECVFALKESYREETDALRAAIQISGGPIRLHLMKSYFPAGDEQLMVYEVTGRIVPPAGIPIEAGCVVTNVATLLCIAQAWEGIPFTQKYLTVTGEVARPIIARVPVGTPVSECLRLAGGVVTDPYVVVNGGPMMGKIMTAEEAELACVTKTMSGLLVLPSDNAMVRRSQISIKTMQNRAMSACIQCSFCTQLCPRHLLGHPLEPHRIMRRIASGQAFEDLLEDPVIQSVALCSSCGVCEVFACPMGLMPRQVNVRLKEQLAKKGIRYTRPDGDLKANKERQDRKIPADRMARRAGMQSYLDIRIDTLEILPPEEVKEVRIGLRQGIGAPSVPAVQTGDLVKCNQTIALCPDGKLGSALHASIDGRVTVTDTQIMISR